MKIQYCSDLHLEKIDNKVWCFEEMRLAPAGDVLVIAGDFYMLKLDFDVVKRFADMYAKQYEAIYWVPGNHEYYGSCAINAAKKVKKKMRP